MTNNQGRKLRQGLGHPVIDVDGHLQELSTFFKADVLDHAREIGGAGLIDRVRATPLTWDEAFMKGWFAMDDGRAPRRLVPLHGLVGVADRRPRSLGLVPPGPPPRTARGDRNRLQCAVSERRVDAAPDQGPRGASGGLPHLQPHQRRAVPALRRPDDAGRGDSRRHATRRRSPSSSTRLASSGSRPSPSPTCAGRCRRWSASGPTRRASPCIWTPSGLDSEHDYDPLWQRCVELGVAVGMHSSNQGFGSRRSLSSYTYNHIGCFAEAGEATAKSLLLGGVTSRFPDPQFRVPRGRGGVGQLSARQPGLPLAKAQRAGHPAPRPRQP